VSEAFSGPVTIPFVTGAEHREFLLGQDFRLMKSGT
jgi:hypothetical protein